MSKTKDENQQPSLIDELMEKGTITIKADSREEIAAQFDELKASAKDVTLSTGAVGRSREDGSFSLQIDVIKK